MPHFPKCLAFGMLASLGFISLHSLIAGADTEQPYSPEALQETAQTLQVDSVHAIQTLQSLNEADIEAQVPESSEAALSLFPIKSLLMTAGKVQMRPMNLSQLVQPVFLIGADPFSQEWLKQNAGKLNALHAIGFLVQANSEADFINIKQLAEGLTIIPMNADAFAEPWNLSHYPVLITAQGIVQ